MKKAKPWLTERATGDYRVEVVAEDLPGGGIRCFQISLYKVDPECEKPDVKELIHTRCYWFGNQIATYDLDPERYTGTNRLRTVMADRSDCVCCKWENIVETIRTLKHLLFIVSFIEESDAEKFLESVKKLINEYMNSK